MRFSSGHSIISEKIKSATGGCRFAYYWLEYLNQQRLYEREMGWLYICTVITFNYFCSALDDCTLRHNEQARLFICISFAFTHIYGHCASFYGRRYFSFRGNDWCVLVTFSVEVTEASLPSNCVCGSI